MSCNNRYQPSSNEVCSSEKADSRPGLSTSSTQDPNFYTQYEMPIPTAGASSPDEENGINADVPVRPQSMFKSLGILDRFLAVWIFLAMAVGIILGALVDSVGPALQKGEFVGVSVPIGKFRFKARVRSVG